jgi:GNAT superfamily N-acetyltransferase
MSENTSIPEGTPAPLPEGYIYADPAGVQSPEVESLLSRVFDRQIEPGWLDRRSEGLRLNNWKGIDIGVRSPSSELIGLGLLTYTGQNGDLDNLAVDSEHRGKGIGQALILERIRQAEERGVTSLYIHNIAPTNPLTTFYEELGFRHIGPEQLGRGPNPIDLPPPNQQ